MLQVPETFNSLKLIVCIGFFVTARCCNLVCDLQDEVEDRDGMATGFGIVDRR